MSMEEMPDFLKKMFEQMDIVETNLGGEKGTWINVQQLKAEDILKKKELDMKLRRMWSKAKTLSSRFQAIMGENV